MQKFAPIEDLTRQGECPSAEDLAAYIDGFLPADEAAQITEHLASCEECYEVYAGTVRFMLDSDPVPAGEVVPFPSDRWKPAVVWTAIAAVLVVGVGLGWRLLAPPPGLMTAEVTAPIPADPKVVESIWTGPVHRGDGNEEVEAALLPDEATEDAIRTGVQLVNLQVSLKAGKIEEAQNARAAIYKLLESQLWTDDLRRKYANLSSALDKKTPRELLPEVSHLATETREVFPLDELSLDLGQWVEAGRLAAIAREPAFFERQDTRVFLRRLLWRDKFQAFLRGLLRREKVGFGETRLDPGTRGHLQEISRILGKGELQERDYAVLVARFEKILEAKYPQ